MNTRRNMRRFTVQTQDGAFSYTGYCKGDPLAPESHPYYGAANRHVAHTKELAFRITGSFPVVHWHDDSNQHTTRRST